MRIDVWVSRQLASAPNFLENDVKGALLLERGVLVDDSDIDAVGSCVIDQLLADVLPGFVCLQGHAHDKGSLPSSTCGCHSSQILRYESGEHSMCIFITRISNIAFDCI